MEKNNSIFVAGHKGMVGSAVVRLLQQQGYSNILTADKSDVNLLNQQAVAGYFDREKPEYVVLAAARVGGINANMKSPASFLYENLQIQNNVIHSAYTSGAKRLLFLGSSCIYPKQSPQPMKEEYLLQGPLEPTNEGYALAKIAGLKMCAYYKQQYGFDTVSLMPCNLYGPNDSFDLEHSHVLSAMVRRFSDAKSQNLPAVTLWGTGVARREFMHVDDVAASVLHFIRQPQQEEFINVGWGEDISIFDLAHAVANTVGYTGTIEWDSSKPNGMLKKCMDVTKMKAAGFTPSITLEQGIRQMVEIYRQLSA